MTSAEDHVNTFAEVAYLMDDILGVHFYLYLLFLFIEFGTFRDLFLFLFLFYWTCGMQRCSLAYFVYKFNIFLGGVCLCMNIIHFGVHHNGFLLVNIVFY